MDDEFNARGIVIAADVTDLPELARLVQSTCHLEFIAGYKIGIRLVGASGFSAVCDTVRQETALPLIYDHQKWGNDIPDIAGGDTLAEMKKAGFDALIIFPFAGIETLRRAVSACQEYGLLAIVGGEMTHPAFLASQGGYIDDTGPENIYRDAAQLGVRAFVVPGTKPDRIQHYREMLQPAVDRPIFFFPGIGKGQGGDIAQAFRSVEPNPAYAIVGRGIYGDVDRAAAAHRLWSAVAVH